MMKNVINARLFPFLEVSQTERERETGRVELEGETTSKFYDHFQNPSISLCQHTNFTERLLKSKQNQGRNKAADASKREA